MTRASERGALVTTYGTIGECATQKEGIVEGLACNTIVSFDPKPVTE